MADPNEDAKGYTYHLKLVCVCGWNVVSIDGLRFVCVNNSCARFALAYDVVVIAEPSNVIPANILPAYIQ